MEEILSQPEDALVRAERHVRQAEEHVAHQAAILEELVRNGHQRAVPRAREVLATLQRSLELAREHLRLEREARGLGP
jgi:hypothetical protein